MELESARKKLFADRNFDYQAHSEREFGLALAADKARRGSAHGDKIRCLLRSYVRRLKAFQHCTEDAAVLARLHQTIGNLERQIAERAS